MNNIGYRIFIIGAGFSVPAGLPTAAECQPVVESLDMQRLLFKDYHRQVQSAFGTNSTVRFDQTRS